MTGFYHQYHQYQADFKNHLKIHGMIFL